MSKKSLQKFDDLDDDELDDLLKSEDESTLKKKLPSASSPKTSDIAGQSEKGDTSSLTSKAKAAGATGYLSGVSDADDRELLQDSNVDALDASVFGGRKSAAETANKSQPQKSALNSSKGEIAEYDDPLASLLGTSGIKSNEENKKKTPIEAHSSSDSRRFEVERPPTRSGAQKQLDSSPSGKPKKANDTINFDDDDDDDDDILLGIDSPRHKRNRDGKSADGSEGRSGSAKSVLDDFFGRKSHSLTEDEKKPNFNSLAYNKEPETKEESFVFGSYVPSTNTSRPSSKRSVRFDDSAEFGNSSSSSDKLRSTAPASYLESVVERDDRDWLEIASGVPPSSSTMKNKSDNRPSSEGQMRDKMLPKSGIAGQRSSEPFDWLGVSRISTSDSSPQESRKTVPEGGGFRKDPIDTVAAAAAVPQSQVDSPAKQRPLSSTMDGRIKDGDEEDGDWLGIKKASQADSKSKKSSLDWLLLDEGKEGSGLSLDRGSKGATSSELKEKRRPSSDFTTPKELPPGKSDNYLGLGEEVNFKNESPAKTRIRTDKTDAPGADIRPESQSLKSALEEDLFGLASKKPGLNSVFSWELNEPKLTQENGMFSSDSQTLASSGDVVNRPVKVPYESRETTVQPSSASNLPDLHLHEQMFRDQQMKLSQQQQEQQAELQRLLQVQGERFQMQSKEQLKAFEQQQQLLMSQPLMPGFSLTAEDLERRIRRLEAEKQFLQNLIETVKQQHQEEKNLLEDSYRKRLELNEEMYAKRLDRLKQENGLMSDEILEKVKLLEKEKSELFSIQLKRQAEWDLEKHKEMDRLREANRTAIEDLRAEHQSAIERVLKTKNLELDAVVNARDHARTLESALHKMEENAIGLQELQSKVEFRHSNSLSERETAARSRDESLKILQDRLERQQHENEVERARLQGLITRLEMQLTNESRELEEAKWKVQQDENSVRTAQQALETERIRLMELVQRDRAEIEKAKTKLLDDQQMTLAQLNKERLQLAEEKAQFSIMAKLKQDDEERTSAKVARNEVEVASSLKTLTAEKSKVSSKQHQLELHEERLKKEEAELEEQKRQLIMEKERLEQVALCVQEKSKEIEDFVSEAARDRQESQRLHGLTKQMEQEQIQRLNKIQTNLHALDSREKRTAEERLSLAKERAALENARDAGLCSGCRHPLNVPAVLPGLMPTTDILKGLRMSPLEHRLLLGQAPQFYSEPLGNIYTAIQTDRSIRMWKIAADKDKEFLDEERYFLEAIKHSPYHLDREEASAQL